MIIRSDGDGVGDHCDCCAQTPSQMQVNASGCAEFDFGDLTGDGFVRLDDWVLIKNCLAGPSATPDPGCTLADLSGDGRVDLLDAAIFQTLLCDR